MVLAGPKLAAKQRLLRTSHTFKWRSHHSAPLNTPTCPPPPPAHNLQVRDQFQATALMLCAEQGHTEMVDSLLSAGADVCCVDENGNSALHLASFYGRTDVVELLLSVDCDVTVSAVVLRPLSLSVSLSLSLSLPLFVRRFRLLLWAREGRGSTQTPERRKVRAFVLRVDCAWALVLPGRSVLQLSV